MKKLFLILIVCGLGISGGGCLAQDVYGSESLGELPPGGLYLEDPSMLQPGSLGVMLPDETEMPPQHMESLPAPAGSGDLIAEPTHFPTDEGLRAFDCQPALLESTGTWLQRGFWFAEADAVLLHRSSGRQSLTIIEDQTTIGIGTGGFMNVLLVEPGLPGVEGLGRLKVGRFLFRDQDNRDHTAEFTIFGGGNWGQFGRLDAQSGNLQVPSDLDDNQNVSFDGAQSSQFQYDSWLNSFELNYHVKQRMLKDRMELEPSGHWVRRAQPSLMRSWLAGVRYVDVDERFDWDAFGIPDANADGDLETGNYDIRTGNHLIGTQLGLSTSYQTARWSLTAQGKGGMYLNMQTLNSAYEVTNRTSGITDLETDGLSWVGEGALIGRWHLRPNFALRTSLEVLHASGIAFAPKHINFRTSGNQFILSGGDLVLLGGAIGFEGYW